MNDSNTDDVNNDDNNWLGFSLSPHMKMEVTSSCPSHHHYYHHPQVSSSCSSSSSSIVPSNFYLSPSHFNTNTSHFNTNTSGICFGIEENSSFHSSLAMMPLKSDGSLCIMEALTRSQTQG